MSRKNTLKYELEAAQSLAADFTTAATVVKYLDNISYQINVTTSDSIGSFYIQGSDDYQVDETTNIVVNAGTWADLTLGGGTPSVASADDTILIAMTQVPFYALRVRYDSTTAGTGVCDIIINARQIGA